MKTTKVTKKIISLLLVLSMMVSGFIVPQPAVKAKVKEKSTVVANTKVQLEKIVRKTENATIYEDGSGKRRADIYAQDIRFKDEKGKLTDYDTSLENITKKESETGENLLKYEYQTTTTDKMTYFPEKVTTKTPILSEHEQYAVKINPKENVQSGTLKKEGKEALQIVYKAKTDDVDFQYESTTDGLKESIILNEKTDKNSFEFYLTLKNCSLISQEELKKASKTEDRNWQTKGGESVFLYDIKEDRLIGTLPAAFMIDAEGDYSEECSYTISLVKKSKEEKQYHMILKASKQYLEDENRTYPVTIDPTVTWNTSDARKFSSAYVCSSAPNTNYTDANTNILCVGKRDTSKDLCRAYLKFEGVESLLAGMYVEKASMELNFHQSDDGMKMYVRQVTSGWGAPEITYSKQPKRAETLAEITASSNMGKTTVALDEEKIDSRARDEGRMCGYEITTSKDDSDTSSSKTAWIYNSVSVNGTKIPKLTIEYYDKEDYTDCPHITYKVYGENKKWSVEGNDGGFAGDNEGEDAMAARALQVTVSANGYSIPSTGIKYRAYSDEAGWSVWKTNGASAGDTSKTYNMKAIEMQWNTTSAEKSNYDLYYRVYVPGRGWLGWAKNAQTAGDYTSGNYISAMEAVVVPRITYLVQYIEPNSNEIQLGYGGGTGNLYYCSSLESDYIMAFETLYKDEVMNKKHMLINSIILWNGNQETITINGWLKGDISNGITGLSSQFNDISMKARYNIEYMGSVSIRNTEEESWVKNGEWLGKTLGGGVLNNVSLQIVPKEYQKGEKACYSSKFEVAEDGYSFGNNINDLGIKETHRFPKEKLVQLYGETLGTNLYELRFNKKWNGYCFGLAMSNQLFYQRQWDYSYFKTKIDENSKRVFGLEAPAGKKNSKLLDLIEYSYASFFFPWSEGKTYGATEDNTKNNLNSLVYKLQTQTQKQNYIMITTDANELSHAVIPLSIKQVESNKYEIKLYNVNYPGKIDTAIVNTDANTFVYENYISAYLIDVREAIKLFGNRYNEIMKKIQNPSYQINNASYMKDANIILAENVASSQITNEEGKCIEDIEGVSKVDVFDNPDNLMYYVPVGTYHVDATENKDASITFVNYDTSVSYDSIKEGEIVANFKKDDSIESNMKLDNTADKVEVSTYDKHKNERSKICSGKQIKVISEDNHASIKIVK